MLLWVLVCFKRNRSLSDSVFRDLTLFFSLFLFCSLYLFVLLVSSDGEASPVLEDCKAVVSNFGAGTQRAARGRRVRTAKVRVPRIPGV